MSNTIIPVNLGFSEYVSQLLRETFDAVISAQSHQLQKQGEIKTALLMDNHAFANAFVNKTDVEEYSLKRLGFMPIAGKALNESEKKILTNFINDFDLKDNFAIKPSLSKQDIEFLFNYLVEEMVEEKKGVMQSMLSNQYAPLLAVESGEITSKLMFHISKLEDDNVANSPVQLKSAVPASRQKRKGIESKAIDEKRRTKEYAAQVREIRTKEYTNKGSNEKVVVLDKTSLSSFKEGEQLPGLRLTVKPATTASASTQLYSEVKINFKSI